MQWGWLAILTSIVVALYALAIWFVCTRALTRCLRNERPPPIRLEVVVVKQKPE